MRMICDIFALSRKTKLQKSLQQSCLNQQNDIISHTFVEYFIFVSAEERKRTHAGYEPQLCANLQTLFSRNDAHCEIEHDNSIPTTTIGLLMRRSNRHGEIIIIFEMCRPKAQNIKTSKFELNQRQGGRPFPNAGMQRLYTHCTGINCTAA
jgi:hypothetical protein